MSSKLPSSPVDGKGKGQEDDIEKALITGKERIWITSGVHEAIRDGNHEALKLNTGEAASFGGHDVWVSFQDIPQGNGGTVRVWEWRAHIVVKDHPKYGTLSEDMHDTFNETLS